MLESCKSAKVTRIGVFEKIMLGKSRLRKAWLAECCCKNIIWRVKLNVKPNYCHIIVEKKFGGVCFHNLKK